MRVLNELLERILPLWRALEHQEHAFHRKGIGNHAMIKRAWASGCTFPFRVTRTLSSIGPVMRELDGVCAKARPLVKAETRKRQRNLRWKLRCIIWV